MAIQGTEIVAEVKADTDHADRGLARFESSLGSSSNAALNFGKVAAVAGGAAVLAFGTKAVMAASDLGETVSKTNAVFKESAGEIQRWSQGSAKNFGQSRQQALEAASSFGNLFVQLGIGSKEAGKMSMQMTELASDFASFHNADPTEVITAQTAAFRGEYDALQRFVPTINAAAVEQKALAMTGKSATKELTLQEKALATQKLMMEGAGDAMGDFDKTAGGLANQLRIAKAQAMDFAANVGTVLIPYVMKAWGALTQMADVIGDYLAPYIKTAVTGVKAFIAAFKEGDVTSDGFVGAMERLGVVARQVVEALAPIVSRIREFIAENPKPFLIGIAVALGTVLVGALVAATGALVAFLAPIVAIPLAIAAVVAGLVLAYQKVEWFRTIVDTTFAFIRDTVLPIIALVASYLIEQLGNAISWVKEMWPQISEAIGHVFNVVKGIFDFYVGFYTKLWRTFGDDLMTVVSGAFNVVKAVIETVVNTIAGIIKFVLAVINGDWGKAWQAIKDIVVGIWNGIHGVISGMLEAVRGVIGGAYDGFKTAITTTLSGVYEKVAELPGKALQWGKDMIQGFIDGIKSMASKIIEAIKTTITDKLPSFVKDALGISSPSKVFMGLGAEVGRGFAEGIEKTAGLGVAAAENMAAASAGALADFDSGGYGGQAVMSGSGGDVRIGQVIFSPDLSGVRDGAEAVSALRDAMPQLVDDLVSELRSR